MRRMDWIVVLSVAGAMALTLGCKPKAEKGPLEARGSGPASPAVKPATPPRSKTAAKTPAKPTIPPVVMDPERLEHCRVKVGEVLPEATLPDLDGKPQAISTLLGAKATAVLFWSAESRAAADTLMNVDLDVPAGLSAQGVKALGVAVGGSAAAVRRAADDSGAKFPFLHDADGSCFSNVAKKKLPRIYLVDGKGRVLWMDDEYSMTSGRQLKTAIEAILAAP